jgi:Xaa-Pro dipeptidase
MSVSENGPAERRPAAPAALYPSHLDVLTERFERALGKAGFDGVTVFAGTEKPVFRDDACYPFRVEPYFKAWVPLTRHPGCAVQLIPGRRPTLIYLQEQGYWHEPAADPQGYWVGHFEIRPVKSPEQALEALGDVSGLAAIGENVPLGEAFAAVNDEGLLRQLDFHRAWKTPYEVACMSNASVIAARGHVAAEQRLSGNPSEFELHHAYCRASGQREIDLPYPSIVAVNEHASTLHYQRLDHEPQNEVRSFLLDAGAQFNGYAADVTRTWSGCEPAFAELVSAMQALQSALCAEVAGGVDFVELNDRAHMRLAAVLAEHELVSCGAEQAYAQGITRAFLPHGLGHLLGLQVHDVGGRQIDPDGGERAPPESHPHLRLTRVLEPGFVLTIEPGLYFIPSLLAGLAASPSARQVNWERVEHLVPCGGIRIEDNVLVEQGTARNLTREQLP